MVVVWVGTQCLDTVCGSHNPRSVSTRAGRRADDAADGAAAMPILILDRACTGHTTQAARYRRGQGTWVGTGYLDGHLSPCPVFTRHSECAGLLGGEWSAPSAEH